MAENNPNARLETFVDGVMAIAITLLVLEIKAPKSEDVHSAKDLWHAIAETWPYWFAFLLSFGTILIAWVNHHNFFKYIDKTSTPFIYANGFFMFTYVTLPFTTALLAENMMTDHFAPAVFLYTFNSLLGNVAWNVLFFVVRKPKLLLKQNYDEKKFSIGVKSVIGGFFVYLVITILSLWYPMTAFITSAVLWLAWLIIGIAFND